MRPRTILTLSVMLVGLQASPVAAQHDSIDWNARLSPGTTLRVYTTNGSIDVAPATDDHARVRGEIMDSGDTRPLIRFEVMEVGGSVIVCALPEAHACGADGIRTVGRSLAGHEPARTRLVVRVPDGVHVVALSGRGAVQVELRDADVRVGSGNGAITLRGTPHRIHLHTGSGDVDVQVARTVTGDLEIRTGRGDVTIAVRGGAEGIRAHTGSGAIDLRLERPATGYIELRTGRGTVTLDLADELHADLALDLGNGALVSDFPVLAEGRFTVRNLRGRIGNGGRPLRVASGNGDVVLRRR